MKLKSFCLSILFGMFPVANVIAADFAPGVYIFGGVGQSHVSINYSEQLRAAYLGTGTGFMLESASFNDKARTTYQGGVGFQALPWLGVELDYVDLRRHDAKYTLTVIRSPATIIRSASYKIDGINLSAVGSLPLSSKISLLGKVGAFHSQLKYAEDSYFVFDHLTQTYNAPAKRQTKMSFGLGAEFHVMEKISIRTNWDRFQDIGKPFQERGRENGLFDNVDLYSLNLLYRF